LTGHLKPVLQALEVARFAYGIYGKVEVKEVGLVGVSLQPP